MVWYNRRVMTQAIIDKYALTKENVKRFEYVVNVPTYERNLTISLKDGTTILSVEDEAEGLFDHLNSLFPDCYP